MEPPRQESGGTVATANYVGKLENGIIRWPDKLYREAIQAILGAPTDAALGFVNARSRRAAVKLEDVDRKNFFHTAAVGVGTLVLGGPIAALLEGSEPTPIPHRIGATEIEQIRTATRVFESWSRNYGGGLAREAVMGQLRWSASLLQATCPDRLRPELYSAVGDLADMAGFMAVDANDHEEAGRVYRFALACAEQAKDWSLRAEVLSSMAKQAIWTGQPDDGLTLAEQALVRSDRLTATVRSLLHTDRAPPRGAAAFHTRQTGGLPLWIGITPRSERVCGCLTPCSPTRLRRAAGRTAHTASAWRPAGPPQPTRGVGVRPLRWAHCPDDEH